MTKSYGGRALKKSIRVYTNDPENEKISLQLAGMVKKFVTLKPSKVFLKGTVGERIFQTVEIIPGTEESFKILKVNALKGEDFTQSIKEIEIDGQPAYELTVENTRQTEGRYFDKIFMITDRTDQAPISVIVSGYIEKPEASIPESEEGAPVSETEPESAVD